jgi:nitrilase
MADTLQLGFAQLSPVWLDRQATTLKMLEYVHQAGAQGCQLLAFGEALLPGYPYWLDFTDGARFNHELQKEFFAYYSEQAIQIERGDLTPFCQAAQHYAMAMVLGTIERAPDRSGHSLYCSLVYINAVGEIANVHRKLQPTYEERLVWSPGDGHGLRTFPLGKFTVGGLNCWENWMPLPRAALYGLGEDLHIAIWPGSVRNTEILTRFLAREGRSYVMSVSGLMTVADIHQQLPHYKLLRKQAPEIMSNGGSCIANPDGSWLVPPLVNEAGLKIVTIDHEKVRRERQNFDPAGHYSRPDVTQLTINRQRQSTLKIND